MRRLWGILLTMATCLSLLLAVSLTGLWLRSKMGFFDAIVYNKIDPDEGIEFYRSLESFNGIITLNWNSNQIPKALLEYSVPLPSHRRSDFGYTTQYFRSDSMGDRFHLTLGIHYELPSKKSLQGGLFRTYGVIGISHWWPIFLFSLVPLLRLRFVLRTYLRRRRGLCRVCGYDLRQSGNECPECGTVRQPASS